MGLRLRLTLLATALVAGMSLVLVLLAWVLAGRTSSPVAVLPASAPVVVDGVVTTPEVLLATVRDQAQADVLGHGSVAVLLVVAAAALLAWTLTGRVLRPLTDVTATAQALSQTTLHERTRLAGAAGPRDEVGRLAEAFDRMLDRLQQSFEAQQRFVADASHELRTPLAVMRTEVDVTLADPFADAAELRRMGEVLRDATDRAEAMVAGLLMVARTSATGLAVHERVDLVPLVAPALAAVEPERAARQVTVTRQLQPATTIGDPALLARVVGNLVENGVRHNVPGGWLRVRTEVAATGAVVLTVTSSGPPVAAHEVAALFEPFHRGGTGRTAHRGSGLGLAIVAAVVQAHAGTVHGAPVPGGGLEVTVTLPPAPPTGPAGSSETAG
ncbi:HAMP domain-containing sensor histidine kinase [Rhodococcus sp. X156]|uniref:sensor histidine kinase n=1 Tax=Rhodococcus sp. X156 TaxID=2499145 RepID=UPI001F493168|nr:HAMP domain-containing sensor histidine kinase [Rhodococcus sp. X156]